MPNDSGIIKPLAELWDAASNQMLKVYHPLFVYIQYANHSLRKNDVALVNAPKGNYDLTPGVAGLRFFQDQSREFTNHSISTLTWGAMHTNTWLHALYQGSFNQTILMGPEDDQTYKPQILDGVPVVLRDYLLTDGRSAAVRPAPMVAADGTPRDPA